MKQTVLTTQNKDKIEKTHTIEFKLT